MTWKEEQRALSHKANLVKIHTGEQTRKPQAKLHFSGSDTWYERQKNGSLKRIYPVLKMDPKPPTPVNDDPGPPPEQEPA